MRGQTCFCQHYGIFRAATGGLLTPRTPVAHLAATSSARCLAFLTLERAHTRPYTILRQAVKSPSNAGWLRSSPVGFAEPFRSVCRNVSGKLPSHPFAALTGLRGCAAGAVGYHYSVLKFCNTPRTKQPSLRQGDGAATEEQLR
jgi:hypothetical protein